MFYIYYKLDNKKQLLMLYGKKISELQERISALIHQAGGTEVDEGEDLYQFAALYRETVLNVLNCSEAMKQLFHEYRSVLTGFSVILSAGHEQDDLFFHMHNLALTAPEENRIWLEDQVIDKFSDYLEEARREEYSHLIPVVLKSDKMMSSSERYRRFLKREDIIPPFTQKMNQWIFRQEESQGIVVRTFCREEGMNVLRAVLQDDSDFIENFLLLEPAEGFWDPWYPLCRFINRGFLDQVELYITSDERIRWDQDRVLMENLSSFDWYNCYYDQVEDDFFQAFILYWKGCLKKLESYTSSPVLIIREPGRYGEGALKLISHLLDVIREHFPSQKYLFLCGEEALPDILGESCDELRITAVDEQNLRLKAADIFPELRLSPDELMSAFRRGGNRLVDLFFFLQNRLEGIQNSREELSPAGAYLYGRDKCSLDILTLCEPGRYCVTRDLMVRFLQSRGISLPEAEERLKRLDQLGYLHFPPEGPGLSLRPLNMPVLESSSGMDVPELIEDFTRFLSREIESGQVFSHSGLFHFLNLRGSVDFGLDILNKIVYDLLKIRESKLAEGLLSMDLFSGRALTHAQQEGLHNIQFAGRLRSVLLRNDRREIHEKLDAGYLSLMEAQGACSEEFLLQQAHYHALIGDSESAQSTVKQSLFAFQKNSDHHGVIRANTALALTMLSQRKLQSAVDYFEIALRISEQMQDHASSLVCGKLMVLAGYLFGNLSMSLRSLDLYMPLAEEQKNRETQIFQIFLKGRILFELGRYQEAFKVLKQGRRLGKHYKLTQESRVITSWMARALCFGHSEKVAGELLSRQPMSLETAYFRAEAAYLTGDIPAGIKLLEEAFAVYDPSPRYIHEIDSWEDGFRLIEGRLSDRDFYEDVLLDQAKGFYYYLIGITGQPEKAWEGLKPLCRMDKAYNQQPFGYYFFLYIALIVEKTGMKIDESHESLVSHAFKLLQTRAGRFDSQQMKHSYFRKNYWNNEIVLKAQELNLI